MRVNHPLTVQIEVKDKDGRVVGRKEVATYHGLLAKAHDEGLRAIRTELVQVPSKENGDTAIVRATVRTQRGTFTGIGDASPGNVNRRIASHLLRMAETRAKARALRDAVNIGVVALEELGELLDEDASYEGAVQAGLGGNGRPSGHRAPGNGGHRDASQGEPRSPQPLPSYGDNAPMSDNQRRFLFRLASQRGVKPDEAKTWLEKQFACDLKTLSRAQASRIIDELKGDGGNGQSASAALAGP